MEHGGKGFKMATPEKAILDYFYIHPDIRDKNDFGSLRVNTEVFFKLVLDEKLRSFLKKFAKKALAKRVKSFLEFMKNA